MNSPHAHLLAQDSVEWRGAGAAALVFGGCLFLLLLALHAALSAVRDFLIWLVGPQRKDDE